MKKESIFLAYEWEWRLGWHIVRVDNGYRCEDRHTGRVIHGTSAQDLETCLNLTTKAAETAIEYFNDKYRDTMDDYLDRQ